MFQQSSASSFFLHSGWDRSSRGCSRDQASQALGSYSLGLNHLVAVATGIFGRSEVFQWNRVVHQIWACHCCLWAYFPKLPLIVYPNLLDNFVSSTAIPEWFYSWIIIHVLIGLTLNNCCLVSLKILRSVCPSLIIWISRSCSGPCLWCPLWRSCVSILPWVSHQLRWISHHPEHGCFHWEFQHFSLEILEDPTGLRVVDYRRIPLFDCCLDTWLSLAPSCRVVSIKE